MLLLIFLLYLGAVAAQSPSITAPPSPTPTLLAPADVTPLNLNAECEASCRVSLPAAVIYSWMPQQEAKSTLAAGTVVTIINEAAGTTRKSIIYNELPSGVSLFPHNEDGTQTTTVTYTQDGTPTSTVLAYPTPFVDVQQSAYTWDGTVPAPSQHGSACESTRSIIPATSYSQPEPTLSAHTFGDSPTEFLDYYGMFFHLKADFYAIPDSDYPPDHPEMQGCARNISAWQAQAQAPMLAEPTFGFVFASSTSYEGSATTGHVMGNAPEPGVSGPSFSDPPPIPSVDLNNNTPVGASPIPTHTTTVDLPDPPNHPSPALPAMFPVLPPDHSGLPSPDTSADPPGNPPTRTLATLPVTTSTDAPSVPSGDTSLDTAPDQAIDSSTHTSTTLPVVSSDDTSETPSVDITTDPTTRTHLTLSLVTPTNTPDIPSGNTSPEIPHASAVDPPAQTPATLQEVPSDDPSAGNTSVDHSTDLPTIRPLEPSDIPTGDPSSDSFTTSASSTSSISHTTSPILVTSSPIVSQIHLPTNSSMNSVTNSSINTPSSSSPASPLTPSTPSCNSSSTIPKPSPPPTWSTSSPIQPSTIASSTTHPTTYQITYNTTPPAPPLDGSAAYLIPSIPSIFFFLSIPLYILF